MPSPPNLEMWPDLIHDAFIIALISFSVNISLVMLFANKFEYKYESNQELYAYGIANAFGSFFSCFPSAVSLSRTTVLVNAGGKTSVNINT